MFAAESVPGLFAAEMFVTIRVKRCATAVGDGYGVIELEDPLLVQFFASASIKLRAQAVRDIGWSLIQEGASLSEEMQARFMRLWESRMELLKLDCVWKVP